jgi:hypothetical protein
MNKENLTTKAIWDFDSSDTIYISIKEKGNSGNSNTFFCQFIQLVGNTVYGRVISIETNANLWEHQIKGGLEVFADFKKCSLYGEGKNESRSYFHHFTTMGYAYKDIDLEETEKTINHPSFGLVGLRRRSSNRTALFGSNIQHGNTISLTIKTAEHNRHLNDDWYHGKDSLIEIEMSGSQFAELITSFNIGDGVPCTIRRFDKKTLPDPPYENPVDIFQREFEATMNNLGKTCESTVEDAFKMLKEKTTISKSDREFLLRAMQSLISSINSSIPFVSQQFNESVEKTVSQAKNEIETFVTNRISSLGLEAARNNPNELLSGLTGDKSNMIGE